MTISIKETKEVLYFGLKLIEGCAHSINDGRITLADSVYFKDAVLSLPPALENLAVVPKELADLDQDELQELREFIQKEFDIPFDKVEDVIETTLSIVLTIFASLKFFEK